CCARRRKVRESSGVLHPSQRKCHFGITKIERPTGAGTPPRQRSRHRRASAKTWRRDEIWPPREKAPPIASDCSFLSRRRGAFVTTSRRCAVSLQFDDRPITICRVCQESREKPRRVEAAMGNPSWRCNAN